MQVDNYVAFDTGIWYAFGMKKVKCQCLSCNHIQFIEEGMTVSCDGCGVDINANEDKYED